MCFPGVSTQQLSVHPALANYTFTIRLFIDSQYFHIHQEMHLLYMMLFLERTLRNSSIVKEPTIQQRASGDEPDSGAFAYSRPGSRH